MMLVPGRKENPGRGDRGASKDRLPPIRAIKRRGRGSSWATPRDGFEGQIR